MAGASKNPSYTEKRANNCIMLTRSLLSFLPECCQEFLRAIEPHTTALTRLAYTRDLKLFFQYLYTESPDFCNQSIHALQCADIDRITANHIAQYSEYLKLYIRENNQEETNGELGRMRKLASLRSFFQYLFQSEQIQRNVAQLIELPKLHEKPILRLEIDEMVRLLDQAEQGDALTSRQQKYHEHTKNRDLAILTLFLGTGIRVSELVGLDIDDIDFQTNAFVVTRKGGAQVILYFPDEVANVLSEYLKERKLASAHPEDAQALFLSLQNRRISVRAVEKMVKKYALLAAPLKRKISPHKLRSTFATNLYQETGDIYLVADVLGHSDINTTRKHYAALSDEHRRSAAKAVKLRNE